MPWSSKHTKWLIDTRKRLKTVDGKEIEVWKFRHQKDEEFSNTSTNNMPFCNLLKPNFIVKNYKVSLKMEQ